MNARYAAAAKLRPGFNRYTFVMVFRAVAVFVISFSVAYGFLSGTRSTEYDPHLFAVGTSTMFALACAVIAALGAHKRLLRAEIARLAERIEELSDRNWELGEAEDRARRFLEAQGDVIVRRNAQGRITYANDAFCALASRVRDDLVGSAHALAVTEEGEPALLGDGTRMQDQKIATPEGERWIAWREVLVREDGKEPELQSVGRDVTERVEGKRALADARDAAQAASRAKSRFLATVSHEIRTPLNGILGMTGLLLDTALTPEQATYVAAVKTSGDTLLALIEEVLDFSKIEAGKLELEQRSFSVRALLEDVVELMAPRAHAKQLEIGCHVEAQLPDALHGDAARLRQVLLNLIGNAIKFTAEGGIAITAGVSAAGEVCFLVRDTGIGIAAEAQERIFAEFEQADGGAGRAFGGTGLGLAISKRIIERMGGRIEVASAPGRGASFAVVVPLAAADGADAPTPILRGVTVLIVSPGRIEATLAARYLRDWGAEVEIAGSKADAEARIAAAHWAVLMIDLALGGAAAATLAAQAPQARRVVLLPPASRPELAALTRAGFDSYLIKPVRAASLRLRMQPHHAAAERAGAAANPDAALEPGGGPDAGGPVLVAEDNEINALLTGAMLRKLGRRATVVPTGAAAIAAWLEAHAAGAPFAAILMDVHMPGLDGIEATRRIRALERERGHAATPILALTANAFADDRQACLDAGMDGVLIKPLERERLKDVLESLPARPLAA